MLLYTMLYIVLAYLMLFAALTNSVCLNNASFFFLFKYFLCQGYELSGEIALKNNHYYYYYYWRAIWLMPAGFAGSVECGRPRMNRPLALFTAFLKVFSACSTVLVSPASARYLSQASA